MNAKKSVGGISLILLMILTGCDDPLFPAQRDSDGDSDAIALSHSPVLKRFGAEEISDIDLQDNGAFLERTSLDERGKEKGEYEYGMMGAKSDGDYSGGIAMTGETAPSADFYDDKGIIPSPYPGEGSRYERNGVPDQGVIDLKGGEIDDNEKFDEYENYFQSAVQGSGYDIDLSQRFILQVNDAEGNGVLGKSLRIVDNIGNEYLLKTDVDGKTYFYPSVYLVTAANPGGDACRGKRLVDYWNDEPIIMYEPCSYGEGDARCIMPPEPVPPRPSCDLEFDGYYYDSGINRCIKERMTACTDPYYFDDIQACESSCIHDRQFEKPSSFTVYVDGETSDFSSSDNEWNISLDQSLSNADGLILDLVFTLDTTGSMSDQINTLKMTIKSISDNVSSLQVQPKIRFGLVIYRDRGDEYLTRIYDFTDNLDEFQTVLNDVIASGGGDYPEDVNTALADTLENLSWSTSKNTVRMAFLIADAPPHMDYGEQYDYRTAMLRAQELGVKIFPIASSGLDNTEGEYMFRQIALITNAKYVFITDAGGGTEYHVDEQDYSVSALDSLVVKLIGDELSQIE